MRFLDSWFLTLDSRVLNLIFGKDNHTSCIKSILQNVYKIEFVHLLKKFLMKILIVEDEKGLRESIEEYFMEAGNICETASSYPEAISKVNLYRLRLHSAGYYPARWQRYRDTKSR